MFGNRYHIRRILMTTDTIGGVWTFAVKLAEEFCSRGISVVLAAMGASLKEEQRAQAQCIPGLILHGLECRLEWMEDPWGDIAATGEWLLGLEYEYRPNIVHLNEYAFGSLPWRSPVVMTGHSCVFSWFNAVKGQLPSSSWQIYRLKISQGLRGADVVTAPSQAMLDNLRKFYSGFHSGNTVYNGLKASDYPPSRKEPFILTAGRLWDEAKNAAALSHIAPDLKWPVYIAGDDRHPDGEDVSFGGVRNLGHLAPEKLASWMGRASIYALPARYEPFGLTALEAALAGCTLVLGDIESLREIWKDAAVFVDPDDHEALRKAITILIADPGKMKELSFKSRLRALTFTSRRQGDEYLEIYHQAISIHTARAAYALGYNLTKR